MNTRVLFPCCSCRTVDDEARTLPMRLSTLLRQWIDSKFGRAFGRGEAWAAILPGPMLRTAVALVLLRHDVATAQTRATCARGSGIA